MSCVVCIVFTTGCAFGIFSFEMHECITNEVSTIPIVQIARILSVAFFGFYGISCFSSNRMRLEFERYKVPELRQLTGGLQIAGALGVVAGYWFRPILAFSAGGLMLMMIYAVITRFKIGDPLYAGLPAFSLALLNAYIVLTAFSK